MTLFCEHDEFLEALGRAERRAERQAENAKFAGATMPCCVCAEDLPLEFLVACGGAVCHFLCRVCFHSNATITNTRPVTSIACPIPACGALFATADARANLSGWEALELQNRQDTVDARVALARAVAHLHCPCGTVAVVAKEDAGNGVVACPGCAKAYCIKCGNFAHGAKPCPPPADTMKWLQKHAKPCPNCGTMIQKNKGCDHMTCQQSASGCGYQFWWSCGCPYIGGHRPGCAWWRLPFLGVPAVGARRGGLGNGP